MNTQNFKLSCITLITALALIGCNDSDTSTNDGVVMPAPPAPAPVTYQYEVTVTNLTSGQPVSPVAVLLHNEGDVWTIGEPASESLETLAEGGDNSSLIAESFVSAGASGAAPIMPGQSEMISVSIEDNMPMKISVVTMLVNTNDAFSGTNGTSIENLSVGESISLTTGSYDSGTEKNTESAEHIPGPAGGGEGFNSMRDDVDFVAMHAGVVSSDDGLSSSALSADHRFDNPTLAIKIMRTE